MTLEFNKVMPQVYKMGAMLEKLDFDVTETLALAVERFKAAGDLDAVNERIRWVRESDVSHYRGAAPLPVASAAEPINAVFDAPPSPDYATIIAADGSQIYPDELMPVHYYLINIGIFVYYHGIDHTPQQATFPDLKFHREYVHDRYGRIIRNSTVDDRRTIAEMRTLAEVCWDLRQASPVVALYDNRLMYLPGNDDGDDVMVDYFKALVHLHDAGASLVGYIDNPFRSKRFMQLLFLTSIGDEYQLKEREREITRAGDLEGLGDQRFFHAILADGQRSAVMVQNSPQNKVFKDRGENYEIAFFYLRVHNAYQSKVVRVDVPVWVARDRQRLDLVHSTVLEQCRLQGRNPYPYAITRADELAWVGGKDRAKLEELVNSQVRRIKEDMVGRTLTAKARGKELARSPKRYHDMHGQEMIDER